MKLIFSIFIIITLLFSCRNEHKVCEMFLSVTKSVDDLSDTLFFSKVYQMQYHKDKIYCIDEYQQQIFVLDKNMHLERTIGEKGEGPYNFSSLSGFFLSTEGIYILDAGNACLFLYTNADSLVRIHSFSADEHIIKPSFRFIMKQDTVLSIAASMEKNTFVSFNWNNHTQTFWGEPFQFGSATQNRIRNGRHLLKNEELLISVSDNMPVIEIYDTLKKSKIKDFDYSKIPAVSKQMEKECEDDHSYYVLCQDVYCDRNKLYILIAENDENKFETNTILVFEMDKNIELVSILRLPGEVYSSFCINDDTVYAYNILKTKLEVLRY